MVSACGCRQLVPATCVGGASGGLCFVGGWCWGEAENGAERGAEGREGNQVTQALAAGFLGGRVQHRVLVKNGVNRAEMVYLKV